MHIAVDVAIRLDGTVDLLAVTVVGKLNAGLFGEHPEGHQRSFRQAVGTINNAIFRITTSPLNQRLGFGGICDEIVDETAVLLLGDLVAFGASDGQGSLMSCVHCDFSFVCRFECVYERSAERCRL